MAGTLPNFLVVGAMKSGTTAFSHIMREHPDIFLHPLELQFFNRNYAMGMDHYRQYFVDVQGEKTIGERTATYLYHPLVPPRIAENVPGVKCIFVLRNPVLRAYSHYWSNVQNATEHLSFTQAIAAEPRRSPQEARRYGIPRGYQGRGEYVRYVKAFLDYVPLENMHFVMSEEMRSNPAAVLARTCRFLGVADDYVFASQEDRVHMTRIPHNRFVHISVSKAIRRLFFLSEDGRDRLLKAFRKHSMRVQPGYPPMDEEMKAQLTRHYAPFNAELAELTGVDVSLWG